MCLTIWIALLAGAVAPTQAPAAGAAELSRLEGVWNEAHLRGDADALERLWADDLVVMVPEMRVMTKPGLIAFVRSGRMKFDRYETSDIRVTVYEDAAVVSGRMQRTRTVNGQTVSDDWRFTKMYVRRAGRWQVVAFHASAFVR